MLVGALHRDPILDPLSRLSYYRSQSYATLVVSPAVFCVSDCSHPFRPASSNESALVAVNSAGRSSTSRVLIIRLDVTVCDPPNPTPSLCWCGCCAVDRRCRTRKMWAMCQRRSTRARKRWTSSLQRQPHPQPATRTNTDRDRQQTTDEVYALILLTKWQPGEGPTQCAHVASLQGRESQSPQRSVAQCKQHKSLTHSHCSARC